MKRSILLTTALALGLSLSLGQPVQAANDQPLEENWAPGEWGPDDVVGAINRITPELVLKAVKLVKQGKVATLGKVYQDDAPMFGNRSWRLIIPGRPTAGPIGPQELVFNDEFVSAELGQVGTQYDGPGHIGVKTSKGHYFYNGHFLEDDDIGSYGMGPLGVEHIAEIGYVCRGVVLDAVALRGGPLPVPTANDTADPGIITQADIEEMVRRQGIDPIGEGDCVFLHTGHGNIWDPQDWDSFDPAEKARRVAEFNSGEPGFGISACEYLVSRKIILWGSDTWGSDAVGPGFGGETPQPFECHIKMMTRSGIFNIENMDLTQLVEDKAYEFFFVWAPLKMKGATGSPGNPVALY